MTRLYKIFVMFLCLAWLPTVLAAGFEQGREYQELPFPQTTEAGPKIEVREFFWYGCPHCYTLEPHVNRWLKRKPAAATFVRTPGTAPSWLPHAQAYYAFENLGVTERLHGPFFEAVQKNRKLADPAAIAQFVQERGVDGAKFREAFGSFGVRLDVEKAKRQNEAYNVSSVPTFVVDGRYVTSPTMAGGEEAVFKVIDHLVEKAAKERAAASKPR